MASKPDIVFLPGAWHPASCLDKFVPLLTAKGYTTYAHTIKSVGTPHVTVQDDAAYIRDEILEPLFQKNRQVVLVVHSYAGTPAIPAVKQLHVKDRKAKGQLGGLVGIIWVTSYLFSSAGFGVVDREAKIQGLRKFGLINLEEDLVYPREDIEFLYDDVDEDLAKATLSSLKPHSLSSLLTDIDEYGYRDASYDGCRAYVKCLKDTPIPIVFQNHMIESSGVTWETRELDTGHSPFLSQPEQLSSTIDELIQGFKI
ncbi:unnamed protein product [Clonostachys rhizophaga]|uniref:AB hydrolase-1 domain-containing protein n=1 Tax=Clonostachys rhizophaga TaxID=160324 RepID=A0A9N9VDY1_9HYPO|nr:unnamed protein product [Clonostachys rhizophaga]